MTMVEPQPQPILTPRQAQCVALLAKGHDDKSGAKKLSISPRTMRFHIDCAKERLHAITRCQLIAIAILKQEITP